MIKLSYLTFFIVMVISCNREDLSTGKASALKNGANWTAKGRATTNKPLNIGIDVLLEVHKDGALRQELFFAKVPYKVGRYILTNSAPHIEDDLTYARYNTLSHDGDVLEDVYKITLDSVRSFLMINEIDEESGWIRGEFEGIFHIDPGRPKFNPDNPDTLEFRNGEFRVNLEE